MSGRDHQSHPHSEAHRPVSDKEEIARAALRSLAAPSESSTPSGAPLLPRPSLATPSYPVTKLPPPLPLQSASSRDHPHRRTYDQDYRHDAREASLDDATSVRTSTLTAHDHARGSMSRNHSSSSFFQDQDFTASPDSSPKLEPADFLPPTPVHRFARHSVPTTSTSEEIHKVALRRASLALGVDVEEVRKIVHQAYMSRRTSNPSSAASASAFSQRYVPSSTAPEHELVYMRQVLDVYCLESERASQSQPACDARRIESSRPSLGPYAEERGIAAPSGMSYNDAHRSSPSHHYQSDRGTSIAWGTRSDERLPTFDSHRPESSFRSARPAHYEARRHEASASSSAALSVSEERGASPSPFAYDAYRRMSQPVSHEAAAGSSTMTSRASHGCFDEIARSRTIDEEPTSGSRSRYSNPAYMQQPHLPQTFMYERRVRSIDDYLEQQQAQQQQQQRERSGSITYHPGRHSGIAEHEEDRLPDRHTRTGVRHSFQPYPPPSSRHAPESSAAGSVIPPAQSPQLSPKMPEALPLQQFSQRRSPLLRSPAAETVASVASSSVTSLAALSPSPLLGALGSSSASLTPDQRKRSPAAECDAQSASRRTSEDTAAEFTRAGVAKMQIDDVGASKGPKAGARKPRSSRSSFSSNDRGSIPLTRTNLSHSEIMQKLQNKVKSRLVAKGKAGLLAESSSRTSGGEGKGTTSGNGKAAKLSRVGSVKRTAASVVKPDGSPLAPPASPQSSRYSSSMSSNTATAEKSAAPVDGVPAPKVRRTVSSQPPKSPIKPLSESSSKPSSPSRQSNTTPTSIEAALLLSTDTPTPSEAAANHAQSLSRSPMSPEGAVETASGQALPGDLPGASQMNASSATKQQTSHAGLDSVLQTAQANDPTETNSAIA
ncbi:uncharacterized protein MEPE_03379 [Melanopsichium pennsylvanicum]|uniref:Uncharacterized protein n=2 Tax=Melanopsichium pennsylvanicum TaxID=63383 RepID=A0AAJ4XM10_9BASI|nr:hypothetical protein BN887_04455 [Melanopsichium pennsylvanicum 4]SNX84670.1 uncharacterized protein MEPE_03379 [Melanopsichium pennsylvanicum]